MLNRRIDCMSLNALPEPHSLEVQFDRVLFVKKVKRGIQDSKEGNVYSKQEAKQKLSKWFK